MVQMLRLLVVFSMVLHEVTIFAKLPEDSEQNIVFPHPVLPRVDNHLPGHLEALGQQRLPDGQAAEYFESPTPRELWMNHVKPYKPAILRGAMDGSPALEKWDDSYLIQAYGDQEVLVEKKFEDRKSVPKRMMLRNFLDQYETQNWYAVSMLPDTMRGECKLPKPLMCGTFRENLAELNLWIGTGGTRSMLHYDADNILHCVVAGKKDWVLIHPKHKTKLDMALSYEGHGSGFSHLDVDSIDENVHHEIWNVPWDYATLYAGDCLYLPPQYLHQVRSYNRSISTTFLFYPHDNFNDINCGGVDLEGYLSLDQVYVYWTYQKDQETVDMGYMNPSSIRQELLITLNAIGMTVVDRKMFIYLSLFLYPELALDLKDHIEWFFEALDQNHDGNISLVEFENSNMEIWKEWCRQLDAPHGPTKSELTKNKEATSETQDFSPRYDDRHADSKNALIFLKFVLRTKGKDHQITYPEFKKWIDVKTGSVSDAFILFDTNFDGLLTNDELLEVDSKHYREFSKMYYSLRGTTIKGGGLYHEEVQRKNLEYLNDLNILDEYLTTEADLKESEKKPKFSILREFFLQLQALFNEDQDRRVNLSLFSDLVTTTELQKNFETKNFDVSAFFNLVDRGLKGYITVKDAEYYILDERCTPDPETAKSEDRSGNSFEDKQIFFRPSDILTEMIPLMDVVDDFILNEKKKNKQNKVKQNGRNTYDNADSEDSGDSEPEEENVLGKEEL